MWLIAKDECRNYHRRFLNVPVQNLLKPDKSHPANLTAWLTAGRFAALLAALITIQFWDVLLGSHAFFFRDYAFYSHPNAQFLSQSIWSGEIPLWNSLSHCGSPFLAQWSTLACYPPSLITCALPLPWSLGYFCLIHLFIAGMSMRSLALRWTGNELAAAVAGLTYAFNGMTINSLMWPHYMVVWAWAPLVLLTARDAWNNGGRAIIWASIVGALHMLGGVPEIILLTWAIVAALFAMDFLKSKSKRRQLILRFASVILIVTALTAVQVLPFLQLMANSSRDAGFSSGDWPMPIWGVANFLVPLFRCTPGILGGVYSQYDQQVTSSYYFGIGIVALVLIAVFRSRNREIKWLGIATLVLIVMAMGDAAGLYLAARKMFPPIGIARYPVKFLQGAALLIPLLAACGFHWQWRRLRDAPRNWKLESILLGGAALLICGIIAVSFFAPDRQEDWRVTLTSGISRWFLLAAFLIGMRYAATFQKRNICVGAQCGLLAILALDLASHTPRQNPTVVTWAYSNEAPPRDLIPPEGYRAMLAPRHRAMLNQIAMPDHLGFCIGQRTALSHNWNLVEGIPKIDGFYSLQLRKQHAIWKILYNEERPPSEGLLDFLGASQISDPVSLFKWSARTNAMPLVTTGQLPVFANSEPDALARLEAPEFDPRKSVILNTEDQVAIANIQPKAARIESVNRPSAHALEIEVAGTAPSLVVIAQSHYSPWRATVNGSASPILPANHAFQAVAVPAGRSLVRIEYRDTLFHVGAAISFLTLIACAAALFRTRRQSGAALPISTSRD